MKKILLLLVLCWTGFSLSAQVGTTVGIQGMETSRWNRMLRGGYDLANINHFKPTVYLGFDYQLPSPKKGVRIVPELSLSQYQILPKYERPFESQIITIQDFYQVSFYSFSLNLDFYLFNFSNRTNIPTFSKPEHWFKKGFFFRVAPTYNFLRLKNHEGFFNLLSSIAPSTFFHDWHNFSVRVAAGIDLGVSQSLTISPIISYTFLNELNWNDLGIPSQDRTWGKTYENDEFLSDAHHFQLGIRLSFLFKKKNIFSGRHL